MPSFDGTGPMGRGSMTGRGTGRCSTTNGRKEATDTENLRGLASNAVRGDKLGQGFRRGSNGCKGRGRKGGD